MADIGIQSAQGQPNNLAILTPTNHTNMVIPALRLQSFSSAISTVKLMKPLTQCGQVMTALKVGKPTVHNGQMNGRLTAQQKTLCRVKFHLGNFIYIMEKEDGVEMALTCDRSEVDAEYEKGIGEAFGQKMDKDWLNYVPSQASPCNTGNNAGVRNPIYNLGTIDSPVVIGMDDTNTTNTVQTYFSKFHSVFGQWGGGKTSLNVVGPEVLETIGRRWALKHTMLSPGNNGTGIVPNGYCDINLGCDINLYTPPCFTTPKTNNTGQKVYEIVVTRQGAVEMPIALHQKKKGGGFPHDLGEYSLEMMIYGFGVTYPEFVSRGYITIDPTINL
jgi:hypothetical protein